MPNLGLQAKVFETCYAGRLYHYCNGLVENCSLFGFYIDVPEGNPSQIVAGTSGWKVFWVFWVMNGFWVAVPILIIYYLWNPLVNPESSCDLPNELEETKSLIAVELPSESKRETTEIDEDKSSKETSVAIERGHA